jgi:hypothetical protein
MQSIAFLSRLLAVFSETTQAWKVFTSPEGVIGYFQDMGNNALMSLREINQTFNSLEYLHPKLVHLKKAHQRSVQAVSHNYSSFNNGRVDLPTFSGRTVLNHPEQKCDKLPLRYF